MAFDESYLAGMVVGKLVSGICALIVAHFLYKHTEKINSADNCIVEKRESNFNV